MSLSIGHRWRIALIVALAVIVVVAAPFTGQTVAWRSFLPVPLMVALLTAVGIFYTIRRPEPRFAAATLVTAQLLAFACVAALANYQALALQRPLVDGILHGWDVAMGFDLEAYARAIAAVPGLATATRYAYETTQAQLALSLIVLGLTGRLQRLDEVALAFMLAAVVTVGTWTVFPSFGLVTYLYQNGLTLPPGDFLLTKSYAMTLLELHAGSAKPIVFSEMLGLIAAPSFHTVMALLAIHAFSAIGWLRWPAIGLNILILLSVPSTGGHHFVDLLIGVAVALAAVVAARQVLQHDVKTLRTIGDGTADKLSRDAA